MNRLEFNNKWGIGGYHAAKLMHDALNADVYGCRSIEPSVLNTVHEFLYDLSQLRFEE